MRKRKSVIGQPVYSLADGTKVDAVKDLVLEGGQDKVAALLVSGGGLLGVSTHVVPFASVLRFGPSAVMIDDRSSAVPAASDAKAAGSQGTVLGSRVLTDGGEDLGTIADLYFDEASGEVTGYEVSGGLIGDATRGSAYLPSGQIRTLGRDAVITTLEAREVIDARHVDGGRGRPEVDPGAETTTDPDGALVGVRSSGDLTDRTGAVVVASGQAITPEMVERAKAEGEVDGLYRAAGVTPPGTESDPTGEALSKAAESASDLWGRFTRKVSEMTDAAGQRVDAQQTKSRLDAINDAIGRPVTKVFLDRDDSVILDLGDLVTHQAVQRADEAGLLDSLLACVYKAGDVTFTRNEMRADIAGDSTVDRASGGASVVTDLEAKLADPTTSDHATAPSTSNDHPDAPAGTHSAGSSTDGASMPGQTIGEKPDTGTE